MPKVDGAEETGICIAGYELRMLLMRSTSFGAVGRPELSVPLTRFFGLEQGIGCPLSWANDLMTISEKNLRVPSADQLEHVVAVLLQLLRADAGDAQQRLGGGGLELGDELQRGVAEHHERRHLLRVRAALAPLAEPLEQLLV